MKKSLFKKCSENYVNWVTRLGKTKSAIVGVLVLGFSAIVIQIFLDMLFFGEIRTSDIIRSMLFGLISAPFVIYFFNVIVEKLEKSRIKLEQNVFELGALREQDYILNKRLEKNSQDKTKLMATISHELRTPLNGIIGLSRILLEDELSQQQKEYLKTINMSAISLGHIFSDIIDLEKIDSKRIELFNQPVEFQQIINDVNHFAHLMAEKKQIHFKLEYPKNLPAYIQVDYARLSQVLWNLISNAVKFTPTSGQILLKIYQTAANKFSFDVQDSGIGIAESEQQNIFRMFYQSGTENKAQGSGIGLAVSKQIAELMNGDLSVYSELDKGSIFTLTIEADVVQAQQTLKIQPLGLKVLLVEDIEMNVIVAKAMLEKFGCNISVAMNGKEAFERFAEDSFDLVLLDIQLPDMTGTQIAKKWRAQYENEEIDYLPLLVALTANIMQTKTEYQAQGLDDVLRKPLSLEALAACLNEHFGEIVEPTLQKNEQISPLVTAENEVLDVGFLQELLSVIGKQGLQANVALFESLMSQYIDELKGVFAHWQEEPSIENRKAVANQAHKIKGALVSVGLKRLQRIAEQAQRDESNEWESLIADWTQQMEAWQTDLQQLKAYLQAVKIT